MRKLTLWLAVAAVLAGSAGADGARRRQPVDAGADERKADYIFMEALSQHERGNEDAYFELISRARELDPGNLDLNFYEGSYRLILAGNDSVGFNRGFNMMKAHFEGNPSEYYNNYVFGTLAERVGKPAEAMKVWTTLDSIYPDKSEVAFKLADALVATRDSANIAKGLAVYDRIEKARGKSIPLTTYKIRALLAQSVPDTAAIIGRMKQLLESSPKNPEFNVFAGDIFMMFDRDSAIVYYDRACEFDPTSGVAHYSRANYYKTSGDSAAYEREIESALRLEDLQLSDKLGLLTEFIGNSLNNITPEKEASLQSLFAELIEQNPHEPDIHELNSNFLAAIRQYDAAAEQMQYVLDMDPSGKNNWTMLVRLCFLSKDFGKAAQGAENALKYFPDDTELLSLLASAYNSDGHPEKALEVYDRMLTVVSPSDRAKLSDVYTGRGDVMYNQQLLDSAFASYEKAIELNPDNMLALNNCAYYMAVQGIDLEKAERMSARTVEADPENVSALDTYAWILFRRKEYVEAKAYIDKVLALEPEPSAELYAHAGDIYYMAAEPKLAVEFWEKALELDPDNALLKKKVKNRAYYYE